MNTKARLSLQREERPPIVRAASINKPRGGPMSGARDPSKTFEAQRVRVETKHACPFQMPFENSRDDSCHTVCLADLCRGVVGLHDRRNQRVRRLPRIARFRVAIPREALDGRSCAASGWAV